MSVHSILGASTNEELNELGISDAVSVIITCEDGTYLLVSPIQGKESYWIFTTFAKNQCWRGAVKTIMMEVRLQTCSIV